MNCWTAVLGFEVIKNHIQVFIENWEIVTPLFNFWLDQKDVLELVFKENVFGEVAAHV